MKHISISNMKDQGNKMYKMAEQFNLGVEMLDFLEPYRISDFEGKIEDIKEKTNNIKRRSIHGAFFDLFPASSDPEIQRVVKKRFLQAYEIAKCIGAKNIVFHAGFEPKGHRREIWLRNAIEFWNDIISCIGENIEIHIENVSLDDYTILKELIKAVNSPIFSVCLDVGHVNVNSKQTLEEWIKGLNEDIRYVHLHNNDGINDKHYGLYHGDIDMVEVLELLEKYAPNAVWTLETRPEETEKSILWLQEKGYI